MTIIHLSASPNLFKLLLLIIISMATLDLAFAESNISILNLDTPGSFIVKNIGSKPIRMSSQIRVQVYKNSAWQDVPSTSLSFVIACTAKSNTKCVEISAGGTIAPIPWTGFSCSVQCDIACRANAYYGPGKFRFVIHACDDKQTYFGSPFDLPAYK